MMASGRSARRRRRVGGPSTSAAVRRRTPSPHRASLPRAMTTALALLLALAFVAVGGGLGSSSPVLAAAAASVVASDSPNDLPPGDGPAHLTEARRLFQLGEYITAAPLFWRAVLFHAATSDGTYTVEEAFGPFIKCYALRGKTADGFLYVAAESYGRGQTDMAEMYVKSALQVEPDHAGALELRGIMKAGGDLGDLLSRHGDGDDGGTAGASAAGSGSAAAATGSGSVYAEGSPEHYYNLGTEHFNAKHHGDAAAAFDKSCELSQERIGVACTNAVYCRTNILDWGPDGGEQFERDMKTIERITIAEVAEFRSVDADGTIKWRRTTSAHPHMMLGYPLTNSTLKRYVAESYAVMDEAHARIDESGRGLKPLPDDLPYDPDDERDRYLSDADAAARKSEPLRLKIGFVASGFNSKAVLYLSHDMFRFFDPDQFEVHIFSTGKPDNPDFIKYAMRGVDWRERVRASVDRFHDVRKYKDSHVELARYVHNLGIHVLIEWDGYARQGERAQGLFALRPAPVQILHQEFLGTSGAQYVDYIVTDKITSPPELEDLYVEKFIYMPNHFFSKGHAMQTEVKDPTYEYEPAHKPYQLGTGNPAENRCLAPGGVGPAEPSFVFCNFNKFLKNNPDTMRSWLRILRDVPDSMLCLLENPSEGVPYLRKFVSEACSEENDDDDAPCGDLTPSEMNSRIHLLPWQANPFDHQMRSQDFCHAMLDSHPYNGHTVAQDALYGGVPIITRSDGPDMSSRVTASANVVLGLEGLNAPGGTEEYERIAVELATNGKRYTEVRTKLIDACLRRVPSMHPYWDVPRYVRNFSRGLTEAWERYLRGGGDEPSTEGEGGDDDGPAGKGGKKRRHIEVVEDEETQRGTTAEDIQRLEKRRKDGLKRHFMDGLAAGEDGRGDRESGRKEEL